MIVQKERRKFTRFRPKDGTVAVNRHALGPITNISMGGLSFRYMGEDSARTVSDILGIFLGSDDFLIEKIPTKVVSDKLISYGSSFMRASTRQRSIQFTELTDSQRKDLKDFIDNKTVGVY